MARGAPITRPNSKLLKDCSWLPPGLVTEKQVKRARVEARLSDLLAEASFGENRLIFLAMDGLVVGAGTLFAGLEGAAFASFIVLSSESLRILKNGVKIRTCISQLTNPEDRNYVPQEELSSNLIH